MIAIIHNILGKFRRFSLQGEQNPAVKSRARRVCAQAAAWVLVATVATLVLGATPPVQNGPPSSVLGQESPPDESEPMAALKAKQKKAILKSNFEKMKRDSENLVSLAKSLQQEIEKSNENVLSLKVVERAEKIEKLAKKIKDSAKGE